MDVFLNNPTIGMQSTKRFDKIISEEVYPSIVKAYAVLNNDVDYDIRNALMITATEHLTKCLENLCVSNKSIYLSEKNPEFHDENIETLRQYFLNR